MSSGWIKLHRELLQWEWYDDTNTKCLFLHCLLRANHSDTEWRGHKIKRGQFLTSIDTLTRETGLSVSQIRTSLKKLISTSELTSKSQARSTVITVVEYDSHQGSDKPDDKLMTLKSQADDIEIATDKNLITKEPKKATKDLSFIEDGFDYWWNAYPASRRKNKKGCLSKFKNKCKGFDEDQVESFVNKLCKDVSKRVAEVEDLKYLPMTEPYLNQERYDDE